MMDTKIKRCFEILEISPDSTYEEAKTAYRLMAQVWHPDKHSHNDKLHVKATSKLQEINAAWSEIKVYFIAEKVREDEAIDTEQNAREDIKKSKQAERDKQRSDAAEPSKSERDNPKNQSQKNATEKPEHVIRSNYINVQCRNCARHNYVNRIKYYFGLTKCIHCGKLIADPNKLPVTWQTFYDKWKTIFYLIFFMFGIIDIIIILVTRGWFSKFITFVKKIVSSFY